MAIRAPFMFAGYWGGESYTLYSYTDAQLQGLGNATEFVVTSGNFQHYFNSQGAPESYYLQVYISQAVDLANRLYNMYGKKVWIGTPLVDEKVLPHNATVFGEVAKRMTYFVDNVMSAFGGLATFKARVNGIYMNSEYIFGTFTSISSHPQVSMFQTLSNYVAQFGLKMMWSPMWSTTSLENAAKVIRQTSIFDYALIQPGYYFDGASYNEKNCEVVRQDIATQQLWYVNPNVPILPSSAITSWKTVIGCQMEIDDNCLDSAYMARYNHYVSVFNTPITNYTKANANFGFYFGAPTASNTAGYNKAKSMVNQFFG